MKVATGTPGSWFATARTGEYLPCMLAKCIGRGGQYFEPTSLYVNDAHQPRVVEYVEGVKQGRVLMTHNGPDGRRSGYNEYIYIVEDVRVDATGLRCKLLRTEKL
jgi:hypothetical protein